MCRELRLAFGAVTIKKIVVPAKATDLENISQEIEKQFILRKKNRYDAQGNKIKRDNWPSLFKEFNL